MDAIDYNFMSDYLLAKNKATEVKDKVPNNIFGSLQSSPFNTFAEGGDLQTHGADWSTGTTFINAGGTHEENPYDGVQLGVDQQGKPNLLEEDETVFNDYVFSKRIKADAKTKKALHLSKNSDLSMADISKKINEEAAERPNDPISQNALQRKMSLLMENQERQKAEELQKQFESLPQEQQDAIIQQIAQQQQLAQQQAIAEQQGQMPPEGQEEQMQNPQMQDMQMMEQQPSDEQMMQMQQQAMQEPIASQEEYAYGGQVNRFDNGGIKEVLYGLAGAHTDPEWESWYKEHMGGHHGGDTTPLDFDKLSWDDVKNNPQLISALTNDNGDLADAIKRGYDFGQYKAANNKYDFADFNEKTLLPYTASLNPGNTDGHYVPDKNFDMKGYKSIEDYENSDEHKGYTQYMADVINRAKGIKYKAEFDTPYKDVKWADNNNKLSESDYNALQTLANTANGTMLKDGSTVKMFDTDNNGFSTIASNAGDTWNHLRTDKEKGIFHLNPEVNKRGKSVKNIVQNEDGSYSEIVGNVPKDWQKVNSYNYQNKKEDSTLNYYKRATTQTTNPNGTAPQGDNGKGEKYVPILKDERLRYSPIAGKVATLGMRALGIGKPNYSNLDAAINTAAQSPIPASYERIGNYLKYDPVDIWAEQNKANANSLATDRYIMNNNAGLGTKMAGLIANGYNRQLANNDLFIKGHESDFNQKANVATFNRDTDKFNADNYNKLSMFNAEQYNRQRNTLASLQMQAAKEKLEGDASWNKGLYTDIGGIFTDLGKIGKENAQHNMIAKMAADNLFGNVSDKQNVFADYIKKAPTTTAKQISARGGKIKRRRR